MKTYIRLYGFINILVSNQAIFITVKRGLGSPGAREELEK